VTREARPQYTFGETPLAAERLRLVARVFDAPSRTFLTETVTDPPAVALDLGCGPGVTTRLLAETTGARRSIGIDASDAFLAQAARDAPPGVEFVRHDVADVPLPGAPVELLYCRLLLAHLPDPSALIGRWASQLTPAGRLLVDELEAIHPMHPVLAEYERIVVALVGSRGAVMYAGPIVGALTEGDGWRQSASTVRNVAVSTADAARMFTMNVTTWRDDPFIQERYPAREIDRLGRDLDALTESPATDEITWIMRQLVYERTG
jgi:ubiquinone/menaquinone biosynthesis C-methylase UbiE